MVPLFNLSLDLKHSNYTRLRFFLGGGINVSLKKLINPVNLLYPTPLSKLILSFLTFHKQTCLLTQR